MNRNYVEIAHECVNFWKELEMYQKDDNGRIPKANDHLINSFQYGLGSLGVDLAELEEPKAPHIADQRRAFTIDEDLDFNTSYKEIE